MEHDTIKGFKTIMDNLVCLSDDKLIETQRTIEVEMANRGLYSLAQRTFRYAIDTLEDFSDDYIENILDAIFQEWRKRVKLIREERDNGKS